MNVPPAARPHTSGGYIWYAVGDQVGRAWQSHYLTRWAFSISHDGGMAIAFVVAT